MVDIVFWHAFFFPISTLGGRGTTSWTSLSSAEQWGERQSRCSETLPYRCPIWDTRYRSHFFLQTFKTAICSIKYINIKYTCSGIELRVLEIICNTIVIIQWQSISLTECIEKTSDLPEVTDTTLTLQVFRV